MSYADLYLFISSHADNQYRVELRYVQPDAPTEQYPESGLARLDFNALRAAARKPDEYGLLLKQCLFRKEALVDYYANRLSEAQGAGRELRVRILIDRSAKTLNDLRWETLQTPNKPLNSPSNRLALDANRPFSRFLPGEDGQGLELRARGALRALVFVANPKELTQGLTLVNQQTLAEVYVAGEVARAVAGLRDIPLNQGIQEVPTIEVVESQLAQPGRASFKNLKAKLSLGYDILYLVCHGARLPEDAADPESPDRWYILLENDDGSYDLRDADELAAFIHNLPAASRPRLAVLSACQSGGQGRVPGAPATEPERSYDEGALSALGPRLAESGIPAVIAQQDNVRMDTVGIFISAFFSELLRHGQVDKAMAVGRLAIQGQPDWWVPVLYLRLRGGRLWFQSGYSDNGGTDAWESISKGLKRRRCTPVLGSGLIEFLTGPTRELARHWAVAKGFPFEAHSLEELPRVAQFLADTQGRGLPIEDLLDILASEVRARFASDLPPALATLDTEGATTKELANLCNGMIAAIGDKRRQQDPNDPYKILAALPINIYITANPDCLLEKALETKRGKVQSQFFCWKQSLLNDYREEFSSLATPSKDNPLVYHLFGRLDEPRSLVLTEEDYFDYLMWINGSNFPDVVGEALNENVLLYLGFQMHDWNFRVLFRSILNESRRNLYKIRDLPLKSVAVQLQPGDDNLRPEIARRSLEKYFGDQFNIYWGGPEDYLKDLWQRYSPGGPP